jgi:hypothetical protein
MVLYAEITAPPADALSFRFTVRDHGHEYRQGEGAKQHRQRHQNFSPTET